MESPDEELLRAHLNDRLKLQSRNSEYSYVKVLLMYWSGSTEEHESFRYETRRLGDFFTAQLSFVVEEYPIPLALSQLSLQKRIATEVLAASSYVQTGAQKSLLIIYYGGHGDGEEDRDGRAVWARFVALNPTSLSIN